MPFTDTHCHLDFPDFQYDLKSTIHRSLRFGVHRIISIATTLESSRRVIEISEQSSEVFATVGVHPCQANAASTDSLSALRPLTGHPRVVAIGECGLDYHYLPEREEGMDDSAYQTRVEQWKSHQKQIFTFQLDLAVETGLPVVIHQRNSWEDVLQCLAPYQGKLKAVFHCFGESPERARSVIDQGHSISFTGILTFKNAGQVRDAAVAVPLDRIMLETDAPYLAPVPFRGQRNEPGYIPTIAETLAEVRSLSVDEVAQSTEAAANAFFHRLPPRPSA